MEDFTRLRVYQHSRALARAVYRVTRRFPWRHSKLAAQLEDSSDSIGANIAEGCGRKDADHGNTELVRYCHYSNGSTCESQHRIGVALDRELITQEEHDQLIKSLLEMKHELLAFIQALKRPDRGPRTRVLRPSHTPRSTRQRRSRDD